MDWQGDQSQKDGQEDQEEVNELGGSPLAALRSPGPPDSPSGSELLGNPSSYPSVEACKINSSIPALSSDYSETRPLSPPATL